MNYTITKDHVRLLCKILTGQEPTDYAPNRTHAIEMFTPDLRLIAYPIHDMIVIENNGNSLVLLLSASFIDFYSVFDSTETIDKELNVLGEMTVEDYNTQHTTR